MPIEENDAVEFRKQGKVAMLDYLIGVAQRTQGGEVWRALYAEMRNNIQKIQPAEPRLVENKPVSLEEMRKHQAASAPVKPHCGFSIG